MLSSLPCELSRCISCIIWCRCARWTTCGWCHARQLLLVHRWELHQTTPVVVAWWPAHHYTHQTRRTSLPISQVVTSSGRMHQAMCRRHTQRTTHQHRASCCRSFWSINSIRCRTITSKWPQHCNPSSFSQQISQSWVSLSVSVNAEFNRYICCVADPLTLMSVVIGDMTENFVCCLPHGTMLFLRYPITLFGMSHVFECLAVSLKIMYGLSTMRCYASAVYAMALHLCVTSRCSTKTAKHGITPTKPHDSSETVVF